MLEDKLNALGDCHDFIKIAIGKITQQSKIYIPKDLLMLNRAIILQEDMIRIFDFKSRRFL